MCFCFWFDMRLEIKCTEPKCLSYVHMGICGMEQSVILNAGLVIVSLGKHAYMFEKGSMDKLVSSL